MLRAEAVTAALCGADESFSQRMLQDAYARLTPAVALLEFSSEVTDPSTGEPAKRDGNALALIVSEDGLAMTNGHLVLENSEPFNLRVTVGTGDDKKKYEASLLTKPDDLNVAFLRLKSDTPLKLPYVQFAPAAGLALGAPVAFVGLLNEALDFKQAIQVGRIAAVLDKPRTTYCLDQNVRFGSVGGPVIDTEGRVVGVIGFDLSRNEGGDIYVRSGHPLIFQTGLFQKYLEHPPVARDTKALEEQGWLGVFTQPLGDDFAEYWGLEKKGGLIVSTVVPNSPGAEAGLLPGDVIVNFNGVPIQSKQDTDVTGFTKLVREAGAGQAVAIKLLRDKQPIDIKVTLGARPRTAQDADEYEDPVFGLTIREITTDLRIALNLAENVKGVIVRRVKSGSAAHLAKIRPGVIIMALGDQPVATLADFKAAVAKAVEAKPAEVPIFARMGSVTGFFRLQPRWKAP